MEQYYRLSVFLLLLSACHPSLITLPPPPERIGGPFAQPSTEVPPPPLLPDPAFVKVCRQLQGEYGKLVNDLQVEKDDNVKVILLKVQKDAELALSRCQQDGAL